MGYQHHKCADIVPRAIKRARDYIATHFNDPDVCEGMIVHAGVCSRTLQLGFRKHFGKTITQYVQDIRLDALHALLAASDGTSSVCDVMMDVGFSHLSRTAGAYKARFGETPSETLTRI